MQIFNHFTEPISVYRRKKDNTEIYVGKAEPSTLLKLPLHCIYAEPKELYFSLEGYKTSVQGVLWNKNPSDLQYTQQVQLDPIHTFEALYINTRRSKAEIYYENTDKLRINSAVFTIHLRPPLYLQNSLPIDIKVSVAGCSVRRPHAITDLTTSAYHSKNMSENSVVHKEQFLDYGEKELNPGHVLHLPTVRMFEKNNEVKSVLVVRVSKAKLTIELKLKLYLILLLFVVDQLSRKRLVLCHRNIGK